MRRSLFWKTLAAILVTFMASILLAGWLFDNSVVSFFSRELSGTVGERLDAVNDRHNTFEKNLKDDCITLMRTYEIQVLSSEEEYDRAVRNTIVVAAAAKLANQIGELERGDLILSVVIYPEKSDYYITSGGLYRKSQSYLLADGFRGDMSAYFGSSGYAESLMQARISPDRYDGETVLTYVYPISAYFSYGRGAVAVNVRESGVCALLNETNGTEEPAVITMTDSSGIVLSSEDKSRIGTPFFSDRQNAVAAEIAQSGYLSYDGPDGKQMLVCRTGSQTFYAQYPASVLYGRLASFRTNILLLGTLITLCGIFASVMLTRRAYRPLQSLISAVRSRASREKGPQQADTELLTNAFQALLQSESDLKNRLEKNELTEKEHVLFCLFSRGEADPAQLAFLPQRACRRALCVRIDNYRTFVSALNSSDQFYSKNLILQLFEQYQSPAQSFCGVVLEGDTIGVICADDGGDLSGLTENLRSIGEEIRRAVSFSVSVGIGGSAADIGGIHDSYRQAKEAAEQRFFLGKGCIVTSGPELAARGSCVYPASEEKHLINSVLSGNGEKTAQCLADFFLALKREPCTADSTLLVVSSMITHLWAAVLEDVSFDCSGIRIFDFLKQVLEQETLGEIESELKTFLLSLTAGRATAEAGIQAGDLIAYIDENYAKDIDTNRIADRFGISYSYVRKLFKEKTGKTIVEYLNHVRLMHAKQMLAGTDFSIGEIAQKCGYYNEQGLFRAFRRAEGVTPGEYRKSAQRTSSRG